MAFEKIKFFGHPTPDGGLRLTNSKFFNECLKKLAGKEIAITLEEVGNTRTLEQNSFYWKYLSLIARERGGTPQGLHRYFVDELLPPKYLDTPFGTIRDRSSSTALTKKEFSEYLMMVEEHSGVPVPSKDGYSIG